MQKISLPDLKQLLHWIIPIKNFSWSYLTTKLLTYLRYFCLSED